MLPRHTIKETDSAHNLPGKAKENRWVQEAGSEQGPKCYEQSESQKFTQAWLLARLSLQKGSKEEELEGCIKGEAVRKQTQAPP